MKKTNLIILVLIMLACLLPLVMKDQYYLGVMVRLWLMAILGLSFNAYTGYIGGLNLSFTAVFGVAAYAAALMTVNVGASAWVGLITAVLVAAGASFIIGFPTLRLRGAYFLLLTMAFLAIATSLAVSLRELTGGTEGIPGIPPIEVGGFQFSTPFRFYFLAFALFLICFVAFYLVVHSRLGRAFAAIRENEDLADSLGINPFKYKLIAFVLAGVIGGVAGWAWAHYSGIIDPSIFGFNLMFDASFIPMIGGLGSVGGPIIGAFFMIWVPETMQSILEYRYMIFPVLMILVIIFMPQGIWGYIQKVTQRSSSTVDKTNATGKLLGAAPDDAPVNR